MHHEGWQTEAVTDLSHIGIVHWVVNLTVNFNMYRKVTKV